MICLKCFEISELVYVCVIRLSDNKQDNVIVKTSQFIANSTLTTNNGN